jgi:hypothetical protein
LAAQPQPPPRPTLGIRAALRLLASDGRAGLTAFSWQDFFPAPLLNAVVQRQVRDFPSVRET